MKTQVNNLVISSFPKILSLKSFGNFVWQFVRQFVRSVFGDNFLFYFFIISWLRLQQEIKWVNINFDKKDLTSAQKSHSSPDDFGKTFLFTLIKQNVTYFSFIFLTQNFLLCLWNLKFKLLLPGTVSFSTSCVCVCVFMSFHRKGFSCSSNARVQVRDDMLRKYFCLKYLCLYFKDDHRKNLQADNCAKEYQLHQAKP